MRIRPLILLAILPLFSACSVVQSKNPLSPRSSAVRDGRIEGLWQEDLGKGSFQYVFFTYHAGRNDGSIMEFKKNDVGSVSSAQYDFFVTRTPKHDYLNVTNGHTDNEQTFPVGRPGSYSFAEYHFNWMGRLVYSMIGGNGFAKAIDEGKLKGIVERDSKKNITAIYLTDSSKRILDFIESSKPQDVFDSTAKLTWVGGP
jgi:hypothetical protein